MKMGPTLNLIHCGVEHFVTAEFQLVTTCISKTEVVYELRTKARTAKKQICPKTFFQELENQVLHDFFKECLLVAQKQHLNDILIHVDCEFLATSFVESLLNEFHDLRVILKIYEHDKLHNLDLLHETITSVKKHENVRVWLDAFGSKMVNFDVIRNLKFDGVAICKEVFWDLYYSDLSALRELIKAMRIKASSVSIDGVDCFEKYQFCKQNNCFMSGEFLTDQQYT